MTHQESYIAMMAEDIQCSYDWAEHLYEIGYRCKPQSMILIEEAEYKDKIYRLHKAMQKIALLQEEVNDLKYELNCISEYASKEDVNDKKGL